MIITGIYKITNQKNGKVYIGQSIDIERRIRIHKYAGFDSARHEYNYPLYRSIRKYGIENFIFEIIEQCKKDELGKKEQYWIDFYDSINPDKGYNQMGGTEQFGHFMKLNQEKLKEIKDLIKNSPLQLKEIAEKYQISLTTIKDINQGHTWYDEKEQYPLRITKNKKHYCVDCGKEVKDGRTIRCAECAAKARIIPVEKLPLTREELKQLIRTTPFTKIGEKYGVTDNAIRKWCDKFNLPRNKSVINSYSDSEWENI